MKKMMAANWKMYKNRFEARMMLQDLLYLAKGLPEDREVVIFPPFTLLGTVSEELQGVSVYSLGGQDVYPAAEGAFTGEIAPGMLQDCGCAWVLTGHSERRHILGESDEFVGKKTAFSLESGLGVVLCVGETLEQREAGELSAVLARQMLSGLASVAVDLAPARLCIAYEPVWAIGTGKVAGPKEILEAHAEVRKCLEEKFLDNGNKIRILYGGSVKPENAAEILQLDNVNGVLVGGASLQAETFSQIILS